MNSTDIVKKILKHNNFDEFEIKYVKESDGKCDYKNRIIYISDRYTVNSLRVAAHESAHALNYRDGVTNNQLLLMLQKLWIGALLSLIIYTLFDVFILYHMFDYQVSIFISSILPVLSVFFTLTFNIYYIRDEAKTENKGLVELEKIWDQKQHSIKFSKIKSKSQRVLWNIYFWNIVLIIMLLGMAFLMVWATTNETYFF